MEQTNTTVNVDVTITPKRPTFITVLCILSFVGIAFSLIGNIMNYFTYSAMAAGNDAFSNLGGADSAQMNEAMNAMTSMLGIDYGKLALSAIITASLNIPLLIGVIMMWKLKKTGFYIYAVFEIIQAIMPLCLGLGLAGGIMTVVSLIFGILFVILYGVNLKHMS